MAQETSLLALEANLLNLRDILYGLRMTVEGVPEGHALADVYDDAVASLLGAVDESLGAASEARQALGTRLAASFSRRALITCQEKFNEVADLFHDDLLSYDRIAELMTLGRDRGGKWAKWACHMKLALEGCRQPLYELNQAIFACWREMTGVVTPGISDLACAERDMAEPTGTGQSAGYRSIV